MKKVNRRDVAEETWESPKGVFAGAFQGLSLALGRQEGSTDLWERHPFDLEITRIPAGKRAFPYHSHSAQWEFYYVLEGRGTVRDETGETTVEAGDAFLFKPGEAHQLMASAAEELTVMTIADNPVGESCFYPDSGKWLVRSPERRLVRSEPLDYLEGEE